jgi:hypothetical protein
MARAARVILLGRRLRWHCYRTTILARSSVTRDEHDHKKNVSMEILWTESIEYHCN